MKKLLLLIAGLSALMVNSKLVEAQGPPFFTDYIDCEGCITAPPIEPVINPSCPHTSPLYNQNSFYEINPGSQIKYIRVNFIIIQKDDGTGNFSESNPEDQQMLLDIQNTMNQTLANLNIGTCGGHQNVHSKIQYIFNTVYKRSDYYWNNDNDHSAYKCPNHNPSIWYLAPLAEEIDEDPTIPHGINIFFTCGATAYQNTVINNSPTYSGVNYACSQSPTFNFDDWSAIHYPDTYIKYYWMKHQATIQNERPWIPDVWDWYKNSSAQTNNHEIGHSFGLFHPQNSTCPLHDIMNPSSTSLHDYYTQSQLLTIHKNLSLKNIRKYVECNENYDAPFIVANYQKIDFDVKLYKEIIIEPGGNLEITCNVLMPKGSKIIVKPGGKLLVNNGIVSTKCNDLWEGIQVWGNNTENQWPDNNGNYLQGYAKFENAIIENAVTALNLWHPEDFSSTGGIVFAYNTTFQNNTQSLHALHYKNFHPINGSEMDYQAVFDNCTFDINNEYFGSKEFFKHIDISYLRGMKFYGCDFFLDPSANNISVWNHGIAAYAAGFTIQGKCTTNIIPCNDYDMNRFRGLRSGITVRNLHSPYTFTARNCIFENLVYGIDNYAANNATILNNQFFVGSNNYDDLCAFGIYQRMATGFAIELNNLDMNINSLCKDHYGVFTMNTNGIDEIYKNYFKGLKFGNFASNKNHAFTNQIYGLAYYCNENTSNYADFYIGDNSVSKIQFAQGDRTLPTGNLFSPQARYHIHNGNPGGYMVYYYNQLGPRQIPDPLKVDGNVGLSGLSINNPCENHYGGDIEDVKLTVQEKLTTEFEYAEAYSNYNNVETLYNSLVDGGSTNVKLSEITTATPDDAWALRSSLMGSSPHLSEEVLKIMSDRTDILSESTIFEILSANPDELRKEDLIAYLEQKENPLPEYMIDILKQMALGMTYKTALEEELIKYNRLRVHAANDMLRSFYNEPETNYEEIRNWLDNLGGISADRQIINTFVQENNYSAALNLANLMPILYNYTNEQLMEHQDYLYLINLQSTLQNENRFINNLTPAELSNVNSISLSNEDIAGTMANGILELMYDQYIGNCPDVNDTTTFKNKGIDKTLFGKAMGIAISNYPNPANQWTEFEYRMSDNNSLAEISIFDSRSIKIDQFIVKGSFGKMTYNTLNLNPGIYFYKFTTGSSILSGKFIVIH